MTTTWKPMAEYINEKIDPPQRVEILKVMFSKWKPGQFAYANAFTTRPVNTADKGVSDDGELVFRVAKTKDSKSGGYHFFSAEGLRFTQPPRALLAGLSDDERVAVDLLLHDGKLKSLPTLVPDPGKQALVTAIAAQLRSLRAR